MSGVPGNMCYYPTQLHQPCASEAVQSGSLEPGQDNQRLLLGAGVVVGNQPVYVTFMNDSGHFRKLKAGHCCGIAMEGRCSPTQLRIVRVDLRGSMPILLLGSQGWRWL